MPVKVLITNGCGSLEGDVNMMMMLLATSPADLFEFYAASVPRGRVYEKLCAMNNVEVLPLEFGGQEAQKKSQGRVRRCLTTARAVPRLARLIRRHQIDVVYTIDRTVATYVGLMAARLTGRPFVLASVYPSYPQGSRMNRLVLKWADRIHIHSEFLRPWIEPCVPDPSRIKTIMLGIPIERYDSTQDGKAARKHLGIPDNAPMVVLAGRLSPFKGHEDLLDAAKIVLLRRPDTYFVLVGHDTQEAIYTHGPSATSYKKILEEKIAALDLGQRVQLAGYVPDLTAVIAAATVSTMPSHEEPFGLVALEGMAMAKPVVACRSGGVPEFVIDGEVGLLVAPHDPPGLAEALLKVIENPELARNLGLNGRRRVERFHSAQQYSTAVSETILSALPLGKQSLVKINAFAKGRSDE